MKDDYLIVDVGSKTTDVVYLKSGIPVESRSVTIEKAMVKRLRQIHTLELELEEREYGFDYTNVIYVGGGAAAVKNFSVHKPNIAYDCDIHANSKYSEG